MTEALLLDTNAAIAVLNKNTALASYLENKEVFVPVIAIAELQYGAERSVHREANIQKIEKFIADSKIINCTSGTAKWYGRIMKSLRAKGRPIPQNDVWIAAIAMQHDLILLTKDKHFDNVDNLKTQDW